MAEALDPAGTPQQQAPDPISADELAKVISLINRFLSKFAVMNVFADTQLTVADWTVMMHLSELKEVRHPYLASITGIAEQRVLRLTEVLTQSGLISSAPSTDPARPTPVLSLTDLGKARLSALNGALQPVLQKAFQRTPKYLVNVRSTLQPLMRIFQS